MAEMADDDYWKSRVSGFNFDYDEDSNTVSGTDQQFLESTTDSVFNLTLEDCYVLPIDSLISKQGLESILQDIKPPVHFNSAHTEETIKKLFLGIPCVLDNYRTLDQKLKLLDAAVETFDGNIILKILLYLEKTLHKKLLYYYLPKRKVALQHYCNYLSHRSRFGELSEVYKASGNNKNVPNLFYLSSKNYSDKTKLNIHLVNFFAEYLHNIEKSYGKDILMDLQKFTVWQMHKVMESESIIEQLASLWKDKLRTNESLNDITELQSVMEVNKFQSEWVQLNVMAALKRWDQLPQHFIKPNVFKKNVIKSVINPDIIMNALHKHNAPTNVLQQFLGCMSDHERSLLLGKKLQCHRFVIDKLVENRDRLGLIAYKSCLSSQSEDYFYLEQNLRSEKRWKN